MPLSEHETAAAPFPEARDPNLVQVDSSRSCCDDSWEAAYLRFETPEQEVRKFGKRLRQLGVADWPRSAQIVEIFCGRGNGLRALNELGFANLEGVDLSARLLSEYAGAAKLYVADCRTLPFPDNSRDVLVVQGGLHHLETLPTDLERVLAEVQRILRPGGLFVVVEPWLTPFLSVVHAVCRSRLVGRLIPKIGALATMIRHERATYESWLGQGPAILRLLSTYFQADRQRIAWGKLVFVGHKPPSKNNFPV